MSDFLDRHEIGKTGLLSSRLGIGSTFNASTSAIEDAFHRGINYLYWGTVRQPDFAKAMVNLAKSHRDEMIVTIQSYSNDPNTIEAEIENCCRESGLESFDFLLLGNRMEKPDDRYVEVFEKLRDRGLVRFVSLSSHNRPLMPKLIEDYQAGTAPYELLMLRYNAVHRGAEKDVFPYVPTSNSPSILTYTATRWGHLLDPSKMPERESPPTAHDCFRYSLSHDAVDMVLCGPSSAQQLDDAIRALELGPLDPEERARMERIGEHLYARYAAAYPDMGDEADILSGKAAKAGS